MPVQPAKPEVSPNEGLNRMGAPKPRTRRPSRQRQTARHGRELVRWEACGRSGVGFGLLLTRACPVSDRNRRVRTRTHGGVGPVAGSLSQSRGPDCLASFHLADSVVSVWDLHDVDLDAISFEGEAITLKQSIRLVREYEIDVVLTIRDAY